MTNTENVLQASRGEQIVSEDPIAAAPRQPWAIYSNAQRWFFIAVLALVAISNGADRGVMAILVEPIKKEFHASDAMMGLLTGFAFAIFYSLAGLPIARYSDRGDRPLVITLAVLTWSVMTAACGFVSSFLQLALFRVGVGAGEAGSTPPSQSLVADYFPPAQRTRAYAILIVSGILGSVIAFAIGAKLAADHGWRIAFFAMGAPGLLLCLFTFFGLHEPRRNVERGIAAVPQEPFWSTLTALAKKRSFVIMNGAALISSVALFGIGAWLPAYMVRVLHMKLGEVGLIFGPITAAGAIFGVFVGGVVTDFLVRRDVRWMARAPALASILCVPFYLVAFTTDRVYVFVGGVIIGAIILNTLSPAMVSLLQSVAGPSRRGMAAALLLLFYNLIGGGGGPFLIGVLSDVFTARVGATGLRWAIVLAILLLPLSGLAAWASARTVKQDMED